MPNAHVKIIASGEYFRDAGMGLVLHVLVLQRLRRAIIKDSIIA